MLKISRTLASRAIFDQICLIGLAPGTTEERTSIDARRSIWRIPAARLGAEGAAAKALRILLWSRNVRRALRKEKVACVNAHSLSVLPLAALLKKTHGALLVYDTHELETETAGSRGIRRYLGKFVEWLLIRYADEVSVVNEPIAEWYRRKYGLACVHVIQNVPPRLAAPPIDRGRLRKTLRIGDGELIFLYQGVVSDGRGIDILLDVFARAKTDKHLVVMGYGPLEDRVRRVSELCPNIHFHPAVPPDELLSFTAGADVGLSLIENISLSYHYSLPNKLFEYLSVGLPVIVSDLPCMLDVVMTYKCGWISRLDRAHLAALIDTIKHADVARMRPNALSVQATYNWEREESALLAMYQGMFARHENAGFLPN